MVRVAAAFIAALAMAGEALGFSPSCLAPGSIRSKAAPSLRMGMMMPSDRREALALGVGLIVLGKPSDSSAFENRTKPKGKFPPTPGTPFKGVGKGAKDGKLPICTGAPNCFSSGASQEEDPEHYYPPFRYSGKSKADAIKDLADAIAAYPPGQNDVDGGGFKTFKTTEDYIWTQFESAKRGYMDDLEFAIVTDGEVQVRTASRRGYLDYQVNAKRLNWFVDHLNKESKGWECTAVDAKGYPGYFAENGGR